ncbi:MAG: T9SS type A sorting domain-containing protein [Flavobacteriales bacterium]
MKKILWTLLCVGWISGSAQSVEENLQKYWRYRERLVKDFVKVGEFEGNSLVISARSIGFAYDGAPLNDDGLKPSRIYFQDATIYQGHYLLTLATEYQLLQHILSTTSNSSEYSAALSKLKGTRSEIYFALNAIDRLGDYFIQTTPMSVGFENTGIHSRDDVKSYHHEFYEEDYSEIFDRNADFILTHSDAHPIEMWGPNAGQVNPNNGGNVMSLDQITSMFTGLMAVYRLVGSEMVQPNAEFTALNLKAEARNIALKIIDYVIKPVEGCGDNCYSFNIYHPNDIFRPAGYELTFEAPFLINIAYNFDHPLWVQKVQSNDVHDMKLAIQVHPQEVIDLINGTDSPGLAFGLFCHNPLLDLAEEKLATKMPITVATIEYAPLFYLYENVQSQWVDFSVGGQPCMTIGSELGTLLESFNFDVEGILCDNLNLRTLLAEHLILNNVAFWGPLALEQIFGLENGYFCLPNDENGNSVRARINDDNVHIFCELSAVANAWNPQYFQWIADQSGMHWIGMLRSVLYPGSTPIANLSKSTIENLYLNTAPCEGPWDDPQTLNLPTANTTEGWRAANRLFHPSDASLGIPDRSFRGEFSGIDYMVYHNLYHCLWNEELPSFFSDSGCECLEEMTETSNLNLPLLVEPKFQFYDDYSINAPSYLSHDLTVFGDGVVDVKNDLVICSPEGTSTELVVQGNAILKLYAGYEMNINSNSSVIIEDGAQFYAGIYPLEDILEDNASWIRIKNGAKLEIRDGATFNPYVRLKVIVEDGGKFIVNDSEVNFSNGCDNCLIEVVGENARMEVTNSTINNPSQNNVVLNVFNGAHFDANGSTIDISPGYFILNDNVEVTAVNSHLRFGNGECRAYKSQIDLIHSVLTLDNQDAFLYFNSDLHLNNSTVKLNNSKLNLRQGYQENAVIDNADSRLFATNGIIELNGEESQLDLFNSIIQITDNSELLFHSPSSLVNGKITVRGNSNEDVFMYQNSVLRINGRSKNYPMLQINDGSEFWLPGNNGKLFISNAGIDLTNGGKIWCGHRLELNNVNAFDDGNNGFSGSLDCWGNHSILGYSDFNNVGFKGYGSSVSVTSSNFFGAQSLIDLEGGSYRVTRSKFYDSGVFSRKLESNSTISQSEFLHNPEHVMDYGVNDQSLVEILVSNCSFKNYGYGVFKVGGSFSSRCSEYSSCFVGVFLEAAALNMSATTSAGYNNFFDNDINIEANQMLTYNLDKGFNSFEPFNACNIWTTSLIPFEGEFLDIPASSNIWTVENDYHVSNLDPTETGYYCYSGSYVSSNYELRFWDPSPATSNACPTEKPTVKPPSRKNSVLSQSDLNESWTNEDPSYRNDSDVPVLITEHFNNIALDSALTFAASHLELYDSTGNDAEAVALFYEIISSDLDRQDLYTRELLDWGVNMMKNGIEGMFFTGELSPSANSTSFEAPVQSYVDVLNMCTDTLLTTSTYRRQFELELLKGQLFITLSRPELAREIFVNLNACSVDSLEQVSLNKWREEAERCISLNSQLSQGFALDSISTEISVADYPEATEMNSSNYYFGTTIYDPNTLVFVSCGNDPSYRALFIDNVNAELYPNPATDMVTVRADWGDEKITDVVLLDSFGRILKTENVSLTGSVVYVLELPSNLSSGMYFIQFRGMNKMRSMNFIKQ